jgi:hypothetical protein
MTNSDTPTPLPQIQWDVGIIDASVQAGFPSPADEHLVDKAIEPRHGQIVIAWSTATSFARPFISVQD